MSQIPLAPLQNAPVHTPAVSAREQNRACAPAILLLLAVSGFGQVQAQEQTIRSLDLLVGKQVIAQRTPLCQPGTFTPALAYAGKQAIVVSLKPAKVYPLPQGTLSRLPPETRAMLEDQQKSATILVKFEDGTALDTCAPVSPRRLPDYFELVPGQNLEPATPVAASVAASGPSSMPPPVPCPVSVLKITSATGGFVHALAEANAGLRGPVQHYLDIRMRNTSQIPVKAIEATAVYSNTMGDQVGNTTILSQNDKSVRPGGEYRGYSVDSAQIWLNGIGEVTVWVSRVRFEDNTMWQDNGSHSCALTTKIKR